MPTKTKMELNQEQKHYLLTLKRKHPSSLIRDRAQVILAREQGLTLANIAKALWRSDDFVKQAIKRFKNGELEQIKLTSNNHKLTKEQRQEIIELIKTQCPKELRDFHFNTQFWSTDILREVIKRRTNVEYKTERSYHNLFKQAGFSFHKPKPVDFRQDPEKIKEFKGALKKTYKSTRIRLSW